MRICACGLFLAVVLLLPLPTMAQALPAPGGERIRVVMDDNYPPYVFRDSKGTLNGYLIDIWQLWQEKTGVQVDLAATDWEIAQKRMREGDAEVIDTIFQTPDRQRILDFTKDYAKIPVSIYSAAEIGGITDLNNLKGFLVGVKAGDACIEKLEEAGITTLQRHPSYEALVEAATAGQVRIFCLDEPPANYLLYRKHATNAFNKAFVLYTGEFHRAVKKGDLRTMQLLNQGFSAITAAEDKALREKWMGRPLEFSSYARNLGYALLALALLGVVLTLWGTLLRRQVRLRTRQLETERTRLRVLLETIPDLIWLKDENGVYRFCNPMFERFFGASEAEIVGKTDYDFVGKDLADSFREHDRKAIAAGKPSTNEEWITFADDGHDALVETTKTPVLGANRTLVGVLGIARDITERKRTEASLRIAATAFESQEGMFITDANDNILRVNQSFCDISGFAAQEVLGKTPALFGSGRHDDAFFSGMRAALRDVGAWQGEIWNRRKNGEEHPEWLTVTAVKQEDGEITHYVYSLIDITQRKASEEEIRQLAFYDPLTRLPNRRLLIDRLQQGLLASARSRHEGALLFIDLDNFKTLNDTLGHDQGDLLLQEVAQRISTCVREGDTVARLGGDEFVVMLEGLAEARSEAASQAETVGEKILVALHQPFDLRGQEYRSSCSIGITLFTPTKNTLEDLMKRADLAMYQAKAAGRNTLRFFDPKMQAIVTARASLEADLRECLRHSQLLLHYQAQVNSAGRVTGAEALVRWQHPQRGLVSPAEFIPLAEETGLILPLGNWVLEQACQQLADWAKHPGCAHLSLAVNVSAGQLRQTDFVEQVLNVLARSGADARQLKLELTESLLLDDVEDIIRKMGALKNHGVNFSLDDFGTGYSSLSYLKRLPLEQLKIDQSFVRDVLIDANDAAIARTVVALAQSLGLSVIAEGVETEAQRDFLADQGCHAYQGYLFSRPLPIAAFMEYLAR